MLPMHMLNLEPPVPCVQHSQRPAHTNEFLRDLTSVQAEIYAVLRALLAQPSVSMQSFQRRRSSITNILLHVATFALWDVHVSERAFPARAQYNYREREVVPKSNRYTQTQRSPRRLIIYLPDHQNTHVTCTLAAAVLHYNLQYLKTGKARPVKKESKNKPERTK